MAMSEKCYSGSTLDAPYSCSCLILLVVFVIFFFFNVFFALRMLTDGAGDTFFCASLLNCYFNKILEIIVFEVLSKFFPRLTNWTKKFISSLHVSPRMVHLPAMR